MNITSRKNRKIVQERFLAMNLSEDVIIEILSRLPVKSLIRFRCVCKSWYVLVRDPIFITKHYKYLSSKERDHLLVIKRDNTTNERVISLLKNDGDETFADREFPPFFNDTFGHVRLIGPCNGIVALYGFHDNIVLWNPVIGDLKILFASQVSRPSDARIRGDDLGIGFDPFTNDLKLIQILFCVSHESRLINQVEIYSSKTNSWKKHGSDMPANIMYYNTWSMVYKNETFCWWAQERSTEVILSFNMSLEIFETVPLPSGIDALGGVDRITRAIFPLKESIALIVYPIKQVDKTLNIWLLDNLTGAASSWTKVSSIGPLPRIHRPLGFWNDGEWILESSSGELVLYNPRNKEIKNLGHQGKRNRLEVIVHKESLFPANQVRADL
ncbi:F-box/kelch-repeat protein At3g23880-like [Primulina huaijiensis]|uniref:F-box/kelch-repeat protein At3g23880-like n=1 Tax=Primulina huaijiensis TaxID=1492673 RepID=UPI003CC6E25F